MQFEQQEIHVEETGPDFILESLEGFLVGAEHCDLSFVCAEKRVVQAHCAVVAAVSQYVRHLLAAVVASGTEEIPVLLLPDVSLLDLQSFLELVYTGSVTVTEDRRQSFTGLLELLAVSEDIGECVRSPAAQQQSTGTGTSSQPAVPDVAISVPPPPPSPLPPPLLAGSTQKLAVLPRLVPLYDSDADAEDEDEEAVGRPEAVFETNLGGGVTLQRIPAKTDKTISGASKSHSGRRRQRGSVKVQFELIQPGKAAATAALLSSLQPAEPAAVLSTLRPAEPPSLERSCVKAELPDVGEPPPVETLLAHLEAENMQKEIDAAELAAADLATKDWLFNSSVGMPQLVRNGDGELSLTHADPKASSRKCERCRCPLCMDPNRPAPPGEPAMHLCHYPNCGKIYKKTSHLRAHLRWHIGDQPYLCSWPDCSRRFTRSDELHRHFRIHTGERKHKCSVCDKCFSRSDHLKKHMLSHHSQPAESSSARNSESEGQMDEELSDQGMETELDPTQLLEVGSYQVGEGQVFT